MPKLGIKCPSCSKVTAIDADRLPDKPVRVACPGCQHKIVIDKTKMLRPKQNAEPGADKQHATPPPAEPEPAAPPSPASPAAAAPPAEPASPPQQAERNEPPVPAAAEPVANPATPAATVNEPAPEPAPVATAMPSSAERLPVSGRGGGAGAALPPGILVGADQQAVNALTKVLVPRGCTLENVATSELASRISVELPPLIIFVADEISSPPLEPLRPIRNLTPTDRRETFVVLVCNNIKTLDGSAAFFYEVNMILNKRDIQKAAMAIASALDYHQRLYRAFQAAIAEKEGLG